MFAITTKYLGPTNTKGARIRATWQRFNGKVQTTESYDYGLSCRDNHSAAAMKLLRLSSSDSTRTWHIAETETGYVFVPQGEPIDRDFGKVTGRA